MVQATLGAVVRHIHRALHELADRAGPNGTASRQQSWEALARNLDHHVLRLRPSADMPAVVNAFARYDDYFGIRRTDTLTAEAFLHQVLLTTALVLSDLPSCVLDAHEIAMMLRATAAGLSAEWGLSDDHDEPDDHDEHDEVHLPSPGDVAEAHHGPMAIWRWKVGHHLYCQYATISVHLIDAATAASDPNAKTSYIARLCDVCRGTTAAMWYAQSSSPQLYNDVIRPSMEAASAGGAGFSGTDNLDGRLMKLRLRAMLAEIEVEVGHPSSWPGPLWQEVWRLYEMQHLDLEHHALIAQKLVGSAPSLKQVRMAESCGAGLDLRELSAVETLRGMASERADAKARFLAG